MNSLPKPYKNVYEGLFLHYENIRRYEDRASNPPT